MSVYVVLVFLSVSSLFVFFCVSALYAKFLGLLNEKKKNHSRSEIRVIETHTYGTYGGTYEVDPVTSPLPRPANWANYVTIPSCIRDIDIVWIVTFCGGDDEAWLSNRG